MKRNGAIGVVVAVLAVAALLMYFVVLPQMKGNKTVEDIAKKAADTVEQAQDAVNDAGKQVEDVAKGTEEAKAAVFAKMARLKSDAEAATGELQALLEKGTPTAEQVAAAKAKVEAALKAATDVKLPDGVDAATTALAGKASESAKAALAKLQNLPADPAAAKAAIADIKADILAALPGDTAAKPADAAKNTDVAQTPDAAKASDAAKDGAETAKLVPNATIVDETKPAGTADTAKQETNPAVPTFDVLRVEKDGSTVIAGRAEPGAKVEVVDGDKAIATTQSDDTGAFVAVLDDPLPSGDHSIVLKATAKDGKSNSSQEIATVSVPKDGKGELLAMVTKPGEASKIMTMPEADKTTELAANTAVTADPAQKPEATETADAAKTTDGAVTTPELPALSTEIAQNPPVVATGDETKVQAKEVAAADPATPVDGAAKTMQAAAEKPASAPEVVVSAVELEGDKIFIAGNTTPRATIRVYADDKIVAEVKADENGRFVADGKMPLVVGNHTIRADVLSKDGAKVEFRASVPFFRPEGDLAVVASKDPAKDAVPAAEPLATGALDTARDEAGKALGLLKDLYAEGKTPTSEELAAARSSTEIALKRLSEVRVAENADAALAEMARTVSQEAEKALATLKALPQDPAAVKSALGSIEQGVNSALKPATELAANTTVKAGCRSCQACRRREVQGDDECTRRRFRRIRHGPAGRGQRSEEDRHADRRRGCQGRRDQGQGRRHRNDQVERDRRRSRLVHRQGKCSRKYCRPHQPGRRRRRSAQGYRTGPADQERRVIRDHPSRRHALADFAARLWHGRTLHHDLCGQRGSNHRSGPDHAGADLLHAEQVAR